MTIYWLQMRNLSGSATDLFRARASAAAGYRRLRAEAVGLLILMRQDPQVGEQWIAIRTDADGQAFFNRTKQRLKHILRSINLESAYDQGSGVSQHVRIASAVKGLKWSGTESSITLYDHEFQQDDPFTDGGGHAGALP